MTPRRNAGGEIVNFDELRPQEQERFAATRYSGDRETSARIAREREIGPTAAQAERFATLGSDFRASGERLAADFRGRFRGTEAAPFDPSALERAAGSMAAQAGGDPVARNTEELVRLFRELVQERPR